MRIAIYGGSFNPPHLGHVAAARTVAESVRPDRLLIVPDNLPPHKELAEESPDAESRLSLCRLAFADVPGAEVSDIELRREGRSYTANTIEELRQLYPNDELLLVMGSDMFLCFTDWYRFHYLLDECTLVVLSRYEDGDAPLREQRELLQREYGARVELISHTPLEISSSEVRDRLSRRLGSDLVPEAVYAEIIRRRWYNAQAELSWLREQGISYLDPKRISHVMGCEYEAMQLAQRWGEDPELAAEAGILHDITKRLSVDEQLNLCEKYGILNTEEEIANPQTLHAKTGAAMAADLFGVNEAVRDAIRWHTTGKPDMTLLEKILWLADYIEPTRDFKGVEKARALAYEDLDAALYEGLRHTVEHLIKKGKHPLQDTAEAAAWYAERIGERRV